MTSDGKPAMDHGTGSGSLEALVAEAQGGHRSALEDVVRRIQDDVYGLAQQMLWHPEDAEDATQDILVRVVTHLDGFRGDSAFRTWVYRVASNYLLTTRERRAERQELTFAAFGEDLDRGLRDDPVPGDTEAERAVLVEEVKIGCSQGMLLCLDRGHRLAYVLGEILGLDGPTAADVLDVTPDAFRKRLSRARRRLHAFLRRKCGLVDPDNPCRCHRRVRYAMKKGRVDPDNLLFAGTAGGPAPAARVTETLEAVESLRREAQVLKTNLTCESPRDFSAALGSLLDEDRFRTLVAGERGS